MSDVRDILSGVIPGLASKSTTANSNTSGGAVASILSTPVKKQHKDTPKTIMEKLQQSFKNLEGETLTFSEPLTSLALKEKRKIKVNWKLRAFRNPVRTDQNLILYHWTKSNEKNNEYKYTKFNKKMDILMYNEEEYDIYLRDDSWTKQDTDLLIDLCKRFDTRFIIVADRFEGSVKRTVEELKDRYYKIQSKLIELRTKPEEDPYHNPLTTYSFNKVYETERKLQADKLFRLTELEVAEEEQLVEKYNNIEKHLLRHTKESKAVMKLSQVSLNNGPMKHYSQSDLLLSDPNGTRGANSAKKSKKRKLDEDGEEKTTITLNSRQSARIDSTLFDLHLGRPQHNIGKSLYNDLKEDILVLLDLQKYYMEKRYHCEILASQKDFLEKEIQDLNIPPEALAMQIDEENETINELIDINNNNSHHHHHHSSHSGHSHSSHGHHHISSHSSHHSSSSNTPTTTTTNTTTNTPISTPIIQATPFQMYTGQSNILEQPQTPNKTTTTTTTTTSSTPKKIAHENTSSISELINNNLTPNKKSATTGSSTLSHSSTKSTSKSSSSKKDSKSSSSSLLSPSTPSSSELSPVVPLPPTQSPVSPTKKERASKKDKKDTSAGTTTATTTAAPVTPAEPVLSKKEREKKKKEKEKEKEGKEKEKQRMLH
ncbi:hypothetical protein CYY_005723 [Polysphondylium violaceum]|uniref:Myb-like domain-containing protein n=1 Tax=Polysphondylium violaceum TaxID=133409 RepID=A0A8J4PT24_9MYCE|nr:hypothetical protein CYY_005723 [Polysphondylium violaceum]